MPLTKPFSDLSGNEYSTTYWRVVSLNIDAVGNQIRLTLYAYRSAEDFAAGKQSLPGGSHSYQITGQEFAAVVSQAPVGDSLFAALQNACESYAISKLDVDTGTKDDAGKPIMVSFFKDALQVSG